MDKLLKNINVTVWLLSIRAFLTNVCLHEKINFRLYMDMDTNQRNHRRKPQVFYLLKLRDQCNNRGTVGSDDESNYCTQ